MRSETLLLCATLAACAKPATDSHPPAAKVASPVKEAELTTVKLTPEAEQRLGIQTAAIEKRTVPRVRSVGADLAVPSGRSIVVSSPMAGTVLAPGPAMPQPGVFLKRGQVVMRLFALPSAADMAAAETRLEAARKRAERSRKLLEEGAVAERSNEDAQIELALAEANLAAARPRGGSQGKLALPLDAPREGLLRDLRVGEGQSVAAGTPLFQVDDIEELWVRVPVFAGDVAAVDRAAAVVVRSLSAKPGDPGREAKLAAAPPSADPLAVTVDLFFTLANGDHAFQPGQRVMADVPLSSASEVLVAPWPALVHDVYGGAWVYEAVAPQTFTRRRVEVRHRSGDQAVLASGPAPGTNVVTAGVAELFGVEFGAGK